MDLQLQLIKGIYDMAFQLKTTFQIRLPLSNTSRLPVRTTINQYQLS